MEYTSEIVEHMTFASEIIYILKISWMKLTENLKNKSNFMPNFEI